MHSPRITSAELPADKELVLRVIPMPGDCNANGDIFGGWVMSQFDLAGAVLPARHASGRIATVAVKEFVFRQPVRVGDIVSFYAKLARVGTSSMTVEVEAIAERLSMPGEYVLVTQATATYVAIDDYGQPRKVPPLNCGG